MSAFWQALLTTKATPLPALVQRFVHDSNPLVRSVGNWGRFPNAGSPFRNGDVIASGGQAQHMRLLFDFTSSGQADEWVGCYGALDAQCYYQLLLNGVLLAERNAVDGDISRSPRVQFLGGGAFYYGGDLYADPFALFIPPAGNNTLEIIKMATSDNSGRNMFFDGFGYNLRS